MNISQEITPYQIFMAIIIIGGMLFSYGSMVAHMNDYEKATEKDLARHEKQMEVISKRVDDLGIITDRIHALELVDTEVLIKLENISAILREIQKKLP